MEEYSNIKNDTFDASNAPNTTPAISKGQEDEAEHQAQQMRQLDAERENKRPGKLEVLRATSGNGAIRFKFGELHHNMRMICHVKAEDKANQNQLINMGIFKPTSGNATKRLRMRQETREAM